MKKNFVSATTVGQPISRVEDSLPVRNGKFVLWQSEKLGENKFEYRLQCRATQKTRVFEVEDGVITKAFPWSSMI